MAYTSIVRVSDLYLDSMKTMTCTRCFNPMAINKFNLCTPCQVTDCRRCGDPFRIKRLGQSVCTGCARRVNRMAARVAA